MALSKSKRDALPDSDFAVPDKRELPMHDAKHVKLAWDMVDHTGELSDDERKAARKRILDRAKELGVDTSDWMTVKAMSWRMSAMALDIANDDHPNKMPFSGVLTKVGEPSDAAPEGSDGRRVMILPDAAERAVSSILGMAVDIAGNLSKHDAQKKVGIITAATVEGSDFHIEGFIYASDFPAIAATIKAEKSRLGFSFEASNIHVQSLDADPLVITDLTFTGAAILYKDKAAYTTTSLAASRADEDFPMTPEELKALLAESLKPINDKIATIEASQAEHIKQLEASKAVQDRVEPHANALEACATGMEAAGVGCAENGGHVQILRKMARAMRAEAAAGKTPHVYRDHDYFMSASAAPAKAADAEPNKEVEALKAELANMQTKLTDGLKAAAAKSEEPTRKTISPQIGALLARAGVSKDDAADGKLTVAALDKALSASNMSVTQRMTIKRELERNELLAD